MPEIVDDKSQYCIPFILERLKVHQARHKDDPDAPPFFLGLNGVQGAGKTVLVCRHEYLYLNSSCFYFSFSSFSLDELYTIFNPIAERYILHTTRYLRFRKPSVPRLTPSPR